MSAEKIITLARGIDLNLEREFAERLAAFASLLRRWNRRVNLTAIGEPGEVLEKHLLDSLTLCRLLEGPERLLDVGSGAGFPAIPLKIVRPELEVWSVDAVRKKIFFQREVARRLDLRNFTPLHARVEELPGRAEMEEGFSFIVSRAFSDLARFASLVLPLLAPAGRIVAMKGRGGEQELAQARPLLEGLGLSGVRVNRLCLPSSGAERVLIEIFRQG